MKQIIYLNIILLLLSCNTNKIENTMNKNSPEYKAFMTQENRFEINACELKYNGKPFKLGMTIKEMENVFGKNGKKHKTLIEWNKGVTVVTWFNEDNLITEMRLIYSEDDLLINLYGNFIDSKLSFDDFLKKSSKLSFDDFFIHDDGYRLYNKECNLLLDFQSPVMYNRIGGGHLSVRGDWKLDETYPIEAISISYIDK